MPFQKDTAKGRVKEGFGALTGNKELKAEGKRDQALGKVKSAAKKAKDKISGK